MVNLSALKHLNLVELKIVETPPNFKGDTQGGKKPATLESGAVCSSTFHVVEGDVIKVDTVAVSIRKRSNNLTCKNIVQVIVLCSYSSLLSSFML